MEYNTVVISITKIDNTVFKTQRRKSISKNPIPFPISTPNRVRAKSSGYTTRKDVAPAAPPEARFAKNHLQN